jgi:micrococcal nuclease
MYQYRATVIRWVDGDTVEVSVDLGFRIFHQTLLRLAGINTPEIHSADPVEREAAIKAMLRASELAPLGGKVIVETSKPDSRDKYGRWLGDVNYGQGSVSAVLIAEGLGVAYDGGKR